jgi:hypothetical protein
MAKPVDILLTDLKVDFFVRKKLNDDRVLQLAMLYEANEPLPPLEVNWENQVIDGRHRKAALEMLGRKTASCHSVGQKTLGDSLVLALKANVGGALPPTKDDIVHTMIQLLNQGWPQRKILAAIPFPLEVSKRYIKDAWGIVLNAKLSSAMKAISEDGLTVKVAAEKFGVPVEKLQEHLNPNRKKQKQQSVAHRKVHIQRAYQGFHRKIAHEIGQLVMSYEQHKTSEEEVFEMFDMIFDLIGKGTKRVEEHRQRFVALAQETSKLGEIDMQ